MLVKPAAVQVKRKVRKVVAEPRRKVVEQRRKVVEPRRKVEVQTARRSERVSSERSERRTTARREQRSVKRFTMRKMGAVKASRPGMGVVLAYARAQVGKRYVSGGDGPGAFDCSGLTKSAYARAGISLPHSSGGQAARARAIPRSAARPGDLVVGPGHVGVYMGGGMMIDAGNRRTGVVYRKLYAGLRVERL